MIIRVLTYQLQTALILAVLILIFELFFRKSGSLNFNRFYLYFISLFAFAIPLISINIASPSEIVFYGELEEVVIGETNTISKVFNPMFWMLIAYFSGVVIKLGLFIKAVFEMYLLKTQSVKVKRDDISIFYHQKQYSPFSFMNSIYINTEDMTEEEIKIVLLHEKTHVQQKHSWDTIFIQILTIAFWFNPLLYILRNKFKEQHEFLADKTTVSHFGNMKQYTTVLLAHSVGIIVNDFSNSFSYSLNKNRIIMMTKQISKHRMALKIAFTLPVAMLMFVFFSMNSLQVHAQNTDNADNALKYEEVDKAPVFPGGDEAVLKFIASNTQYPEMAKEKGISGKVYVKFEINKKGKVKKVSVGRSAHPILDKEAIRVIESMPDWIPAEKDGKNVRVEMVIPINFALK